MEKRNKKIQLVLMAMLTAFGTKAQGNGTAGITEATQMVTSYLDCNGIG